MPEMISIGWPSAARARSRNAPLRLRSAQRIGADDAHAFRLHVVQPLAEAFQARERCLRRLACQSTLLVEAGAEPHHLAQAIQDDELPVRVAGDDHVETVGAQVDRGDDVRDFAGHGGQLRLLDRAHIENDEPQPQVVAALGLRMTNCAPSMSSR